MSPIRLPSTIWSSGLAPGGGAEAGGAFAGSVGVFPGSAMLAGGLGDSPGFGGSPGLIGSAGLVASVGLGGSGGWVGVAGFGFAFVSTRGLVVRLTVASVCVRVPGRLPGSSRVFKADVLTDDLLASTRGAVVGSETCVGLLVDGRVAVPDRVAPTSLSVRATVLAVPLLVLRMTRSGVSPSGSGSFQVPVDSSQICPVVGSW